MTIISNKNLFSIEAVLSYHKKLILLLGKEDGEELKVEVENANAETGVVIHKRKGTTDVGEWYASMPFWMYMYLLKDAGYIDG